MRITYINILQRKRLIAEDMQKVAKFMYDNPTIVKLDLCYNDFGDDGLAFLVDEYLTQPNNLKHLNIASCNITWVGMSKLCDAADTMKSLETLIITGNKMGSEVKLSCLCIVTCIEIFRITIIIIII